MADVRPFRAIRPRDDLAARVIAPPYDVLSEDEARAIAREPLSFVRVTRPEVDMAPGTDPHGDAVYHQGARNLWAFVDDGTLVEDQGATYYLYGQVMGAHRQVGILAACSVSEYDRGLIKKHEFTRPDKEDDRTHHMEVLNAQVGLVFLAYRQSEELRALVRAGVEGPPSWRVVTDDGVEHALWPVPEHQVGAFQAAFTSLPALYIADGHHRSAAASRVAARRKDSASAYFLAGLFPDDALQVLAYNRVVHDLNGLSTEGFLAALDADFDVQATALRAPEQRGTVTMYLAGRWYLLTPRAGVIPTHDPVAALDVSVLQDRVLATLLGIEDPRRSQRITFVGGIRGSGALEHAVDSGAAVAFHLFPTGLDQLFDVADAGQVMPPKSTWFEPKLREGVVSKRL
jgi:uncharacterized protein (DUF1015 family)